MNDKHKKANSEVLAFTGERFVPEVHGNIELEHLHRYLQACEIAVGKVVLDIASGEGYGSAMLARRAGKVIGVDISVDLKICRSLRKLLALIIPGAGLLGGGVVSWFLVAISFVMLLLPCCAS